LTDKGEEGNGDPEQPIFLHDLKEVKRREMEEKSIATAVKDKTFSRNIQEGSI